MLRFLHPRLLPLAAAAAAVAAGAFHTLHRASLSQPNCAEISGPAQCEGRRIEDKERIAQDAAAGRLTLLEAAAAYRDLDAQSTPYPTEVVTNYDPGASVDEGYCRMVIAYVRAELPTGQAEESANLLEAELDARLKDGSLRLPNAPAASPERPITPLG